MNLVNVANVGSDIYLFTRNGDKLDIKVDNSFRPFYYEPDPSGTHVAYDGKKLRKCVVSVPYDIQKYRSQYSYSSDISHTKNYVIHKIDSFDKCDYRYVFLDIEVLCSAGLPDVTKAIDPVSCITVYDSYTKSYKTFWANQYPDNSKHGFSEETLLNDFINYIKQISPDIILSWNINFDYPYLHNRCKSFAKKISPISEERFISKELKYPCGISIVDYLSLFKKVFMREASYKLDYIAQKHLKEDAWEETDFSSLDDLVRDKNINDIKRLVDLENKFHILDYFDEVRRLCMVQWEELYYNSFMLEMILFKLAQKKGIVLPNVPRGNEDTTFEGAIREVRQSGALFDIGKVDLSSAYPSMIVNFCLDPANILEEGKRDINAIDVQELEVLQNEDALCPAMVKELMVLKDNRKADMKVLIPGTDEYKEAKRKYDAVKGLVNSSFGAMGLKNFRLYDNRIATRIAGLVRELLTYCIEEIEKIGFKVIYFDTDSVFLDTKDDITDLLNDLVQKWGLEKYGKSKINTEFVFEGYFSKIFIIARCRYIGELVNEKGEVEQEIKGVEMKRSSSTAYEKQFQKTLLDSILDGKSKTEILEWILTEKERIKSVSIKDIAFPCKVRNEAYTKNIPIFLRACENTKLLGKFNVETGELFYYIYVKPRKMFIGNTQKLNLVDVLAFKDDKTLYFNKEDIDWVKVIDRNIISKAETVFEAMSWSTQELKDDGQTKLF